MRAPKGMVVVTNVDDGTKLLSPIRVLHSIYATATPHHQFPFAGCCIHCGSDGGPDDLTKEHMIPEALGGQLFVPKACCSECRDETGAFEGRVISALYGAARAKMGIRRKRTKKWPRTFKGTIEKDGKLETNEYPIDQHPTFLVGLHLYPAGIFLDHRADAPMRARSVTHIFLGDEKDTARWQEEKVKVFMPGGGLQFDDFARFLAKIAHTYASGRLGIGSFIPYLTKGIRNGQPNNLSYYVGCKMSPVRYQPANRLHEFALGFVEFPNRKQKQIIVYLKLFASFEMPEYEIIVGEATGATKLP
jgi:hypothetical protein